MNKINDIKKYLFFLLIAFSSSCFSQELYIKTYGNQSDKPLLFLHGGPGYNCASFEFTTAENLAKKGFYVIVYDRRGEGRSLDDKANFTFDETFKDINNILQKNNINKVSLLGHSFGGMIATLFAEKYPEKVNAIFLIGAPISLQESFTNIVQKCKTIYETKKDQVNLNYLKMLENMDKSSLQYSTFCFMHAMNNGFYSPKESSDEAKMIKDEFKKNPSAKLVSEMTVKPTQFFWQNEKYTTLDLSNNIKQLVFNKVAIFGLYGMEDGLYSVDQIDKLKKIIGENNLIYLENCSHSVYIDQQKSFIETIAKWIN
jgi:proline iminopeptidase